MDILKLFLDGGAWMYPTAAAGLAAVGLAVAHGFSLPVSKRWVIGGLGFCVAAGFLGTSFKMVAALDYIAAGPHAARVFWLPLPIAATGVLPAFLACCSSAFGAAVFAVSTALRSRAAPAEALAGLLDGLIASALLTCLAVAAYAPAAMVIAAFGAAGADHLPDAMATGLASALRHVGWPAAAAAICLLARAAMALKGSPTRAIAVPPAP